MQTAILKHFGRKMVGKKEKSRYRKTRKGKPFSGTQWQTNKINNKAADTSQSSINDGESQPTCVSSSRRKMNMQQDDTEQPAVGIGREIPDIQDDEYRLISVKNLSSVLTEIHGCGEGIYLLLFVYDNAFAFHILIYTYVNFVRLVT